MRDDFELVRRTLNYANGAERTAGLEALDRIHSRLTEQEQLHSLRAEAERILRARLATAEQERDRYKQLADGWCTKCGQSFEDSLAALSTHTQEGDDEERPVHFPERIHTQEASE